MLPLESVPELPSYNFIDKTIAKTFYPGWEEYVSICQQPELITKFIKDNPLFIMHPGLDGYLYAGLNSDTYLETQKRLKDKISASLEKGQSILVFTPRKFLHQTLEAINSPNGVILVPTKNHENPKTHKVLLLESSNKVPFYNLLSNNITRAEACGEYGHQCILTLMHRLAENVRITLVDDCITPQFFRNYTKPYLETAREVRRLSPAERKTQADLCLINAKKRKNRRKKAKREGRISLHKKDLFISYSRMSDTGLDNVIYSLSTNIT